MDCCSKVGGLCNGSSLFCVLGSTFIKGQSFDRDLIHCSILLSAQGKSLLYLTYGGPFAVGDSFDYNPSYKSMGNLAQEFYLEGKQFGFIRGSSTSWASANLPSMGESGAWVSIFTTFFISSDEVAFWKAVHTISSIMGLLTFSATGSPRTRRPSIEAGWHGLGHRTTNFPDLSYWLPEETRDGW